MRRKHRQKFLAWIMMLCLLFSMTVQPVFAEGNTENGNVQPQEAEETGRLEFQLGENDSFQGTTVTYANGYQLSVSYDGIGSNSISTDENGHTELRDIPSFKDITFTLTLPDGADGPMPNLMINGAPDSFSADKTLTRFFNFSEKNIIPVALSFPDNENPPGGGGQDNPPQPGDVNLDTDVRVTIWIGKQQGKDSQGNPVYSYEKVTQPLNSFLFEGLKMNGRESKIVEDSGTILYEKCGYALTDTNNKNEFSLYISFGAKAEAVYLLDRNQNGELSKIEGSDFTVDNEKRTITLDPAESYDIAIIEGISDDVTIIWTTDYDKADKWNDGVTGGDFAEDMYLAHGQAEIVSVTRGGDIIYDDNNKNNNIGSIEEDFGHVTLKRGDDIVIRLSPDYGYQLKSASLNGTELTPDDENVSTFEIRNIQGNIHFAGAFEKAENTSTNNLDFTVTDGISSVVSSGTLNMSAEEAPVITKDIPDNYSAVGAYDITLQNRVSKGIENAYWTSEITDLGNASATVSLKVDELDPKAEYSVLRSHDGEAPTVLPARVNTASGTITFETDKFSTYTIITPEECTAHTWNVTITFASNGKSARYSAVCDRCGASASGNAVVRSAAKTAATYTTKGTTRYTAAVTLDGQKFTATKDVQDIPVLTRIKMSSCTVALSKTTYIYTGKAIQPSVTVKKGSGALKAGTDYSVSYKNNTNPGTATVTITGKGKYTGSITKNFKITVTSTKITSLQNTSKGVKITWQKAANVSGYYVYRGNKKIKTITSGKTTTYTDTASRSNGSSYSYKVYSYVKTRSGKIINAAASPAVSVFYLNRTGITSLSNTSGKKATVKWLRNSKASGYQIQYCTRSDFSKGVQTVTISGRNTVSKKISGLKKGTRYYFRVRCYKTIGKNRYYSEWCNVKNKKITR